MITGHGRKPLRPRRKALRLALGLLDVGLQLMGLAALTLVFLVALLGSMLGGRR